MTAAVEHLQQISGPSVVNADPAMLRGVFQFMLQDLPRSVAGCKGVRIRCGTEEKAAAVRFEYDGADIRPDLLRKVALPPDSAKDGGSGLECVPVHRIISAHGGKMWISPLDSPTVVTMTVPLCGE
jgi:nitrogen-specific signal transduction histidine kinase